MTKLKETMESLSGECLSLDNIELYFCVTILVFKKSCKIFDTRYLSQGIFKKLISKINSLFFFFS